MNLIPRIRSSVDTSSAATCAQFPAEPRIGAIFNRSRARRDAMHENEYIHETATPLDRYAVETLAGRDWRTRVTERSRSADQANRRLNIVNACDAAARSRLPRKVANRDSARRSALPYCSRGASGERERHQWTATPTPPPPRNTTHWVPDDSVTREGNVPFNGAYTIGAIICRSRASPHCCCCCCCYCCCYCHRVIAIAVIVPTIFRRDIDFVAAHYAVRFANESRAVQPD